MEQTFTWVGAHQNKYDFATALTPEPMTLRLMLQAGDADLPALEWNVQAWHEIGNRIGRTALDVTARVAEAAEAGMEVLLTVPPVPVQEEGGRQRDDRIWIDVAAKNGEAVPACRVEVRRTRCRVGSALLQYSDDVTAPDRYQQSIRDQRRAALRWYGWNRWEEVLGLKRITRGRSGSDVTVYRPRLSPPPITDPLLVGVQPLNVWEQSWGTTLLVKTSKEQGQSEEWERYRNFVADRLQPFMARCDELITAQPVEGRDSTAQPVESGRPPVRFATMIGAFLGSDLLRTESLEAVVRAADSPERIEEVIAQVFRTLGPWYAGGARAPLWHWKKMFWQPTDVEPQASDPIRLFPWRDGEMKALDLFQDGKPISGREAAGKEAERKEAEDEWEMVAGTRAHFTRPLSWDVPFVQREHLEDHVVGPPNGKKFGLLRRLLKEVKVRYSLIHGDLHGGNVLADSDNVWLLDWGRVAVGPTLFDFTKMEVYLRLNCLKPTASAESVDRPAARFEGLLLDHFLATEGSLEPAAGVAEGLGTSPQRLLAVARGINAIRQAALPYGGQRPDRLEYLTVLYLTVFQTLTYANAEEAVQFRMLMALYWLLEDTLSRMMSGEPYERDQAPVEASNLLRPHWLAAPGAPERVLYAMTRPDGQRALPALAETRGILQGEWHHLDVFDHTLLALAYLEELLDQPVRGMTDPLGLDGRVRERLASQGMRFLPFLETISHSAPPVAEWVCEQAHQIEPLLMQHLNGPERNLVKWAALLHDVGKTGTRLLNTGRAPKVQFIGHEAYGAQLVRGFLRRQFPSREGEKSSGECKFIENLILAHHQHHTLHDEQHYGKPERWNHLKTALQTGFVVPSERTELAPIYNRAGTGPLQHFPWLILLGFADMLACRGVGMRTPIQRAAEIDLALLVVFFRSPVILHRQEMEKLLSVALRGLGENVGLQREEIGLMKKSLEARFYAETCPPGATAPPNGVPSPDDVRHWAEAYAAEKKGAAKKGNAS